MRPEYSTKSPIGNPSCSATPLSASSGQRSPYRALQTSRTPRLPPEPPSPDKLINLDCAFPPFLTTRARSATKSGVLAESKLAKPASNEPPVPSPRYPNPASGNSDIGPPPVQLPPLELKGQSSSTPGEEGPFHKRDFSIDSKSSYRTSYSSKMSMPTSNRKPSLSSLFRGLSSSEALPPMPPPPARSWTQSPSSFRDPTVSASFVKREGSDESGHRGFDLGAVTDRTSFKAEIEKMDSELSHTSQPPVSPRISAELFLRTPSQPSPSPTLDIPHFREERAPPTSAARNIQYKPFRPSAVLQQESTSGNQNQSRDAPRKQSNADDGEQEEGDEEALSVSNFARSLGLEFPDSSAESSSSESSPSETRSGSSMSSIPSEGSWSQRKPSELSRLGSVIEELQPKTRNCVLDEPVQTKSPTALEPPPPIPADLISPDSPTDPAIVQGSVSLIPENKYRPPELRSPSMRPHMTRSATAPQPRARPKGRCKGCGEMIMGKSVSSADGRLTGRYHRACFVCYHCRAPFETADFYVLDDLPYCAQHYHELNGSLCSSCNRGIEGQYLETIERTGRGAADRQKFHPECLRCHTCHVSLKGEYFEWNGQVYCERDARRAAAVIFPQSYRRPTMGSSPLSQYPPDFRGSQLHGGRPDHRPAPSGARRYPERRTTKLMMI